MRNHLTDLSSCPQQSDRCAYLGRVSSPKQKLEHQREAVLKFAYDNRLIIPPERWFEDKVRRHKQLTEGKNFGRLMELAEAGEVDWILIATFDRWGISDKDDMFVFRKKLKKLDVRLWSVADELEITGSDDASFWRVAARAEAATSYVGQQAQKNIQKMLSMAKLGLAGTGNAPFGVDLVCYPLIGGHAPDLSKPMFRVIRERYIRPALYRVIHYKDGKVEREEHSERMPLRDKKTTAYRYERSEDQHRLRAVNIIYELYDSGMNFGPISDALSRQGFEHYDKPFGHHGVESILRNCVYTGMPAWGKSGVGNYYLSMDGVAVKANRKSKDAFTIRKSPQHYTQPHAPLWDPIVPIDLWERAQARLDNRPKTDPAFGKRRQNSHVKHPLNGKVYCPDCGERMVMGSSQSKGYIKRYFVCGLYRRTIRKQCKANSIPFATFDNAIADLLAVVKDRIDALTMPSPQTSTLLKEEWAKSTELGRTLRTILNYGLRLDVDQDFMTEQGTLKPEKSPGALVRIQVDHDAKKVMFESLDDLLTLAVAAYNLDFSKTRGGAQEKLADVEAELERIALALMGGIPSATVRTALDKRMVELEETKRELTSKLVPLTATAEVLREQLRAIRSLIDDASGNSLASLLDAFIERVNVAFEGEPVAGHSRPLALEFVPRNSATNVLSEPMKLFPIRTDRGSSRPPG
jgi:Resolvase, N terminal domain/Recombinase/Recombinase zinc beta ribbon domain